MGGWMNLTEHQNVAKHKIIRSVQRGKKLKTLAKQLGVAPQTMTLILNTDRLPSLKLAYDLKNILGIQLEDWFAERFSEENKNEE